LIASPQRGHALVSSVMVHLGFAIVSIASLRSLPGTVLASGYQSGRESRNASVGSRRVGILRLVLAPRTEKLGCQPTLESAHVRYCLRAMYRNFANHVQSQGGGVVLPPT
jgi:hypothetical protein